MPLVLSCMIPVSYTAAASAACTNSKYMEPTSLEDVQEFISASLNSTGSANNSISFASKLDSR
jgi:hypothetical protein